MSSGKGEVRRPLINHQRGRRGFRRRRSPSLCVVLQICPSWRRRPRAETLQINAQRKSPGDERPGLEVGEETPRKGRGRWPHDSHLCSDEQRSRAWVRKNFPFSALGLLGPCGMSAVDE
jgi:hypothetical protein